MCVCVLGSSVFVLQEREIRRQRAAQQRELDNQRRARERTMRQLAYLRQQEIDRERWGLTAWPVEPACCDSAHI